MARDKDKKVEEAEPVKPPAPSRRRLMVIGVLAGIMLVEGIIVFVLVKSFSRSAVPDQAAAAGPGGLVPTEGQRAPINVEIKVGEFRGQNRKGQQSYFLQFSVFASVPEADKQKMDEAMVAKAASIRDRFGRVVRSMEPERFVEPDLTTLRSQLKEELRQVLGAELKIEEVLLTDFSASVEG